MFRTANPAIYVRKRVLYRELQDSNYQEQPSSGFELRLARQSLALFTPADIYVSAEPLTTTGVGHTDSEASNKAAE